MSTTIKNWVTVERGRRFRATNSRPEDWSYTGRCAYGHSHCQLCGTEIMWNYELRNGKSGQSLLIGSECIKWYYEAWMPNGLEMAIERMKSARKNEKRRVIIERIKKFANDGNRYIVDYLFGRAKRGYLDQVLHCLDEGCQQLAIPVSKFRASVRRKGYLRPDEIKLFDSGYGVSYWGRRWVEEQHMKNIHEEEAA